MRKRPVHCTGRRSKPELTPRCAAVTDCYLSDPVTGSRRREAARLCKYPTNRPATGIDSAVANKSPSVLVTPTSRPPPRCAGMAILPFPAAPHRHMVTSLIVRLVAWSVRRPVCRAVARHRRAQRRLCRAAFQDQHRHQQARRFGTAICRARPRVDKAFPQRNGTILAVVEAPAPEFANAAAQALTDALQKDAAAGRIGRRPAAGRSSSTTGCCSCRRRKSPIRPRSSRARAARQRTREEPEPDRAATTLSTTLGQPLLTGQVKLPTMAKLLARSAATVDDVLAGKPAAFSWRALVDNDAARQPRARSSPCSPWSTTAR